MVNTQRQVAWGLVIFGVLLFLLVAGGSHISEPESWMLAATVGMIIGGAVVLMGSAILINASLEEAENPVKRKRSVQFFTRISMVVCALVMATYFVMLIFTNFHSGAFTFFVLPFGVFIGSLVLDMWLSAQEENLYNKLSRKAHNWYWWSKAFFWVSLPFLFIAAGLYEWVENSIYFWVPSLLIILAGLCHTVGQILERASEE